jgi:hypothetical protein
MAAAVTTNAAAATSVIYNIFTVARNKNVIIPGFNLLTVYTYT